LGPAEKVELRWHATRPVVKQAMPTLDGLVLWDITPAGDRIRTRLICQSSEKLETLRLLHPVGLILRSIRSLGSNGFLWSEDTGKDEWTVHADPPIEPGATIELDCWMGLEASRPLLDQTSAKGREVGKLRRELVAIQPIGVERYSGVL